MKTVEYELETHKDGHRFRVDETRAPFDGKNVLIKTSEGWLEAYWVTHDYCGCGSWTCDCDLGFYWYSDINNDMWMLDEIDYWADLPRKENL